MSGSHPGRAFQPECSLAFLSPPPRGYDAGMSEEIFEKRDDIHAKYRCRFRRQVVCSIGLAILAAAAILFGLPVMIGFGMFFALLIFTIFNWRCPACESSFQSMVNPRFCPSCGVNLRN